MKINIDTGRGRAGSKIFDGERVLREGRALRKQLADRDVVHMRVAKALGDYSDDYLVTTRRRNASVPAKFNLATPASRTYSCSSH